MSEQQGFYTLKGYASLEQNHITASMEDYLEMICRLTGEGRVVRVSTLAEKLHVKPSSASKMVENLKESGLTASQKYGHITLTQKGRELGRYLLHRHDVLHRFLRYVNRSANELAQVEKIEHFIDARTVKNLQKWLDDLGV